MENTPIKDISPTFVWNCHHHPIFPRHHRHRGISQKAIHTMSMTKTADSVTSVDESLSTEALDKISTGIPEDGTSTATMSDTTIAAETTSTTDSTTNTVPVAETTSAQSEAETPSTEPLTMKTDVTDSVKNVGLLLMIVLSAFVALWVAILTYVVADFADAVVGWSAAITVFVLAGVAAGTAWVMWLRNHTPWAWVVLAASLPLAWTGMMVIQLFNT